MVLMKAVDARRSGVVTTTVHVCVVAVAESVDFEEMVYVYVPTTVGVTEIVVRPEIRAAAAAFGPI